MKHNAMLTITSLLSILFVTLHIAEDIVRGFEPGGFKNLQGVLIMVLWMCGTLLLAGRRSGYIIMLLGAILGVLVSIAHMRGAGLVGGRIANSSGMLFWVWTLLALGVTSVFSVILSARGLWSLRRASPTGNQNEGARRRVSPPEPRCAHPRATRASNGKLPLTVAAILFIFQRERAKRQLRSTTCPGTSR
jgi:hypothetical protein